MKEGERAYQVLFPFAAAKILKYILLRESILRKGGAAVNPGRARGIKGSLIAHALEETA